MSGRRVGVMGLGLVTPPGTGVEQVSRREVFTAYVRTPKGPVFMSLMEKTFGEDVTTRTWDTIKKVAR